MSKPSQVNSYKTGLTRDWTRELGKTNRASWNKAEVALQEDTEKQHLHELLIHLLPLPR